jgi:hypothetical protein
MALVYSLLHDGSKDDFSNFLHSELVNIFLKVDIIWIWNGINHKRIKCKEIYHFF